MNTTNTKSLDVEIWAAEQHWIEVVKFQVEGKDKPFHLEYIAPSGHIVNFNFRNDGAVVNVYEGRREGG